MRGGGFVRKLLGVVVGLVALLVIVLPSVLIFVMGISKSTVTQQRSVAKLESVMINVYLHEKDKVETMSLEEYIKGVVGAEMPAEFEPAALEAQAVAARTYAVKSMRSFGGGGVSDHPDADVSTDFTKNQAWLSEAVLKERWGKKYEEYSKRISEAVDATHGQILVYEDKPISAVFHSTSGGRTASAKEVWGYDYPYLQSVECKWDEKSPRYSDSKSIALSDIESILGPEAGVMAAVQSGDQSITKVISLTESGRVNEIRIGSKTFKGQEVRTLLGLRSENFTVALQGDQLVFKTLGYGHGVGMSQYGANGMAKLGKSYKDILLYFYTGVKLKNIYEA
jgi:stage II sporulation protein D